jgi:GAF domain-containing protein
MDKSAQYQEIRARLEPILITESDEIAVLATVACELFHGLDPVSWAGFYRLVQPGLLKVGPYQGTHGCLTIPLNKGVCGRCARENRTQVVYDVRDVADHIACSSSTRSEIVVPIRDQSGRVRAVLDLDSEELAAFDQTDAWQLEALAADIGQVYDE